MEGTTTDEAKTVVPATPNAGTSKANGSGVQAKPTPKANNQAVRQPARSKSASSSSNASARRPGVSKPVRRGAAEGGEPSRWEPESFLAVVAGGIALVLWIISGNWRYGLVSAVGYLHGAVSHAKSK